MTESEHSTDIQGVWFDCFNVVARFLRVRERYGCCVMVSLLESINSLYFQEVINI